MSFVEAWLIATFSSVGISGLRFLFPLVSALPKGDCFDLSRDLALSSLSSDSKSLILALLGESSCRAASGFVVLLLLLLGWGLSSCCRSGVAG